MKMTTCCILLKGCCRTGLKVRRYLSMSTCAVIWEAGAWVLRNRNQGEEEEDNEKVAWSTACRSRKGYRIGAWSEESKNSWFPEEKRAPSLCWCDRLKWWVPPSWALVWVICDQACSGESCMLWQKTHAMSFKSITIQRLPGSFPPLLTPALSGAFFKLFWNTYVRRALFSFDCVLRLGQSSSSSGQDSGMLPTPRLFP